MPGPPLHPARLAIKTLEEQSRFEAIRSAGPGGQHRNKVSTGVRLTHLPTGIQGMATERRSQLQNKVMALSRLRLRLALDFRSSLGNTGDAPPTPYEPSPIWRSRVRNSQVRVNPAHLDFPALLAEVLDRLAIQDDDLDRTAADFAVTRSQLVKFLALEKAALARLNERRRERGEGALRTG